MPEENNQNPNPVQPPAVEPVAPVAESAFPVPAPVVAATATEKPRKSILSILLILIVVILGIAAGVYFYVSGSAGTQAPVPEVQSPVPTEIPVSPTPAEVSDSLDMSVIEEEIDQTDLNPVDPELKPLDEYTDQL